jgi:hypothetical protein
MRNSDTTLSKAGHTEIWKYMQLTFTIPERRTFFQTIYIIKARHQGVGLCLLNRS